MGTVAFRSLLGAVATAMALVLMMVLFLGVTGPLVVTSGTAVPPSGDLATYAPVPTALRQWVLRAGALCSEIPPAYIAAQLELESSWDPTAYTDVGEVPAKGIAQFTDATWATWGGDRDGDGQSDQYDPEDSILAQGMLMCDLAGWVRESWPGRTPTQYRDLAWAAYFCGRGCLLSYGGIPPSGLAHDYPGQILSRLPRYLAASTDQTGSTSGWTRPAEGDVGSGFHTSARPDHDGVDIIAARGVPVRSVGAGTVKVMMCQSGSGTCDVDGGVNVSGCGWYLDIQHAGGVVTRYCHLGSRPLVGAGDVVRAGQLLGYVGSSGNSSGPHLHFEVHTGWPAGSGNAVEPVSFMRSRGVVL